MTSRSTLQSLTDRQLVNTLTTLALFERAAIAKLVAALAEFDRRRLFLPLGFTSLFAYCTNRLGLSQDEAFYRIEAARIARRYPAVLDYLEKGALNLTTVRLLGPHLTDDNHKSVLEAACHQKKPDVEILIARLKPRPDVPPTIRKLPPLGDHPPDVSAPVNAGATERRVQLPATADQTHAGRFDAPGPTLEQVPVEKRAEIPAGRPIIAPLSEASYRLQVTISKSSHDTLREIQALIRHVIPSGNPATIVERALDLLLTDLKKRKTGQVLRPRAPGKATRGRHVPAHVRRAVWSRDGGRCAFVSPEGTRCEADSFLEYHHVRPYARGGAGTIDNIEMRCRAHNQHEAEIAELGRRR